ncbi:transcriptional regulator, AraC family [Chitinophaga jiangningensis]|uniref:Transcriptional regulator, AraC family n=1 Tax=Chitinophaga jiangningensis TaxID=1419482 RepID=A0A1M7C019_9BACT|nr:AraC family transcriptional regulator [Chitinophaga jiangningensis]SHL60648.1 transcriptional regulator, AraC family [Chitinophaga jiangningensis]
MPVEIFNLDQGYAVFSNSNYQTRKHAHYLIEVVFSHTGTFSISTAAGEFTGLTNAILPPNVTHSFDCLHATCDLLFLDPLSPAGRYFMQAFTLYQSNSPVTNHPDLDAFHVGAGVNIPLLLQRAGTPDNSHLDERIRQCLRTIDALAHTNHLTLTQLSKASYLSEGRLSHLFKNQLGISVHQYILWKRLMMAILKSRQGSSLTACAHDAGFTDSSHFTRVFYKMFGIKPFFALKS